jgi:tRNA(Ile2) C34 agmatinyltransferase TiaS
MILLGKARRELKALLKDQCNSITVAKAMKLLKDLEKELEKRAEADYTAGGWSVADFETQARRLEFSVRGVEDEFDPEDHSKVVPKKYRLYERSTFKHALDRMAGKASELNWETVEYYLDQYCRISRNDIEEEVA